jgi:putative copper export protein/mono/diheme cytochrome c family protein
MELPFDLAGGLPLTAVRFVAVAALLSVTGVLAFEAFVLARIGADLPAATAATLRRRLACLAQGSVAVAVAGMLGWLVLEAAAMADATRLGAAVGAVPAVVGGTEFGRLIAAQVAGFVLLAVVLGRGGGRLRIWAALALAVGECALQAGHSHAASMYQGPSFLLAADVLHLLAAGVWLGGLMPLLLVVRAAPPRGGAMAARWFTLPGKICVVVMAATALFQGWVLVASIPGLVGTAYGLMALVKLALFGVLFAFALANRYQFAPALRGPAPEGARAVLLRSLAVQTGFGIAVVVAAAVLSGLPPAMHEQALWPFAERFSLDTVNEDADFRREAIEALAALGAAGLLLVGAAVTRRHRAARMASVAVAAVIAWFAIPHLDLLFVPAGPTSYFHSPTGFAATAIVAGADLYPANCAACHGRDGHGDGPLAKSLPVPPADLTAAHLWMHSDGELFGWLADGIEAPEGGLAMPGFADRLSDDQRWDLIDYIRAHNAGLVHRASGEWTPALQAPGLQAACADGERTLADLRGGFVRLVFGTAAASPGVTTILATADPAAHPAPGLCVAGDEVLPRAYAIATGLDPARMAGTQILIDGAGWLRAVEPAGVSPRWDDATALAAEIQSLAAHPVAAASPMKMDMPM